MRSTHLCFRRLLMTLRELTSGFDIWSRAHLRMTMMHLRIKFGAYIFIQSGVIDIFPKFKMAAAAILDFQAMWIWPFRRLDSMVFVLCTEFGSNICYTHWDRRTCFRPSFDDVTRINFRFRHLVTWSSPHGFDAHSHKIWSRYLLSNRELLTFFRNSIWRPPPSWIFRLCKFHHSSVLIVWYVSSVTNLVQISVIITKIDALMLQTFI